MKIIAGQGTTKNKTAIHYLDLFDNYKSSDFNMYNYDNTIYLGKANSGTYVGDDCSSFAAAVYHHYLNSIDEVDKVEDRNSVDLWTTGSSRFKDRESKIMEILIRNGFEIYKWDTSVDNKKQNKKDNTKDSKSEDKNELDRNHNIYINEDFKLKPGDLLYRDSQNGKNAHVEFYLGEDHSFGWGEIHSSFENENESKHFRIIRSELKDYNIANRLTKSASNVSSGENYKLNEKINQEYIT